MKDFFVGIGDVLWDIFPNRPVFDLFSISSSEHRRLLLPRGYFAVELFAGVRLFS